MRSGVGRRSVGSHDVELAPVRKPVALLAVVRSGQQPLHHYPACIPAAGLHAPTPRGRSRLSTPVAARPATSLDASRRRGTTERPVNSLRSWIWRPRPGRSRSTFKERLELQRCDDGRRLFLSWSLAANLDSVHSPLGSPDPDCEFTLANTLAGATDPHQLAEALRVCTAIILKLHLYLCPFAQDSTKELVTKQAVPDFDCPHSGNGTNCPECEETRRVLSEPVDPPLMTAGQGDLREQASDEVRRRSSRWWEGPQDWLTATGKGGWEAPSVRVPPQTRAGRCEDLMGALSEIFPAKATIDAASQFSAITPRQCRILRLLLDPPPQIPRERHGRRTVNGDLDPFRFTSDVYRLRYCPWHNIPPSNKMSPIHANGNGVSFLRRSFQGGTREPPFSLSPRG